VVSLVERNTNLADNARTSGVWRDTDETPRPERLHYTAAQLRRQDHYSGPAEELNEDECRALLTDLLYMFGADHDFYCPLPPLGLPGIAKETMDPYGIEWRIITIGLRYLGAAARNEGRAMHHRWREARELAQELLMEGEAKHWAREVLKEERRAKAARLVYFIAAQSGPIKIGIAVNPLARLSGLQTSHHEKLELLATCGGGMGQEKRYHYQFRKHRLKGEWFERAPEILAEIDRLNEIAKAA
jgi:hypothetical protein